MCVLIFNLCFTPNYVSQGGLNPQVPKNAAFSYTYSNFFELLLASEGKAISKKTTYLFFPWLTFNMYPSSPFYHQPQGLSSKNNPFLLSFDNNLAIQNLPLVLPCGGLYFKTRVLPSLNKVVTVRLWLDRTHLASSLYDDQRGTKGLTFIQLARD